MTAHKVRRKEHTITKTSKQQSTKQYDITHNRTITTTNNYTKHKVRRKEVFREMIQGHEVPEAEKAAACDIVTWYTVILLYYTMLYCTIVYYTIIYYNITEHNRYYTTLHSTIL